MISSLKDKVAIVTGASAGIGRAIALKLAAEGAKVVVNGRTQSTGEEAVKAIREAGGEAIFVSGDVLAVEQMREVVDRSLEHFGHVDILVASAGGLLAAKEAQVSPKDNAEQSFASRLFANLKPSDVVEKVSISTLAKIIPVHAVVNHMISRNSGSILFITSEGGRFPTPGQTVASLAAGGLIMMTKVVAKELSRFKVRVNTVAVTLVEDTPSWEMFVSGKSNRANIYSKIQKQAPFGLAKPKDIAEVAAFLVSDSAAFITGATVSATGGLTYS